MANRLMTDSEQKQVMLDILTDFAKYCQAHDLQYFLDAGTLLGAVRHHGYIPWDDDIDVNLPRKDYDAFIALTKASGGMLNDHIQVEYPEDTMHVYLKLGDVRTTLIEYPDRLATECMVYIDIFPKDGLLDKSWRTKLLSKTSEKLALLNWFHKFSIYAWKNEKSAVKRIIAACGRLALRRPNAALRLQDRMIHRYAGKHPADRCKYVTTLVNGEFHKIAPKACFDQAVDMEFEGRTFKGPAGYDAYLRCLYPGDYMQLPPVEKRVKHDTIVFWKEEGVNR